eukprot:Rmarinus@m.13618
MSSKVRQQPMAVEPPRSRADRERTRLATGRTNCFLEALASIPTLGGARGGGRGEGIAKGSRVEQVRWLEALFLYLHTSSPTTHNSCAGFRMPCTFVFKYQRPAAMYFIEDGRISKKADEKNLQNDFIVEHLSKKAVGNEIVAYYIHDTSPDEAVAAPIIEYFDRDSLNNFMNHRKKESNGIIQQFVKGGPTNNSVIRLWWTPYHSQVEMRVNSYRADDDRVAPAERVVTFDGREHQSEVHIIEDGPIWREANFTCTRILTHIAELLPASYFAKSICLYFKLGPNDKLYLLWCPQIRLGNSSKSLRSEELVRPGTVRLAAPYLAKDSKELPLPNGYAQCANCHEILSKRKMYPVAFRYIINQYDLLRRGQLKLQTLKCGPHVVEDDRKKKKKAPHDDMTESGSDLDTKKKKKTDVEDGRDSARAEKESESEPYERNRRDGDFAPDAPWRLRARGERRESIIVTDPSIPPVLLSIDPELKKCSDFSLLRNKPRFLAREVDLCESCCLRYQESAVYTIESDVKKIVQPDQSLFHDAPKVPPRHRSPRTPRAHVLRMAALRGIQTAPPPGVYRPRSMENGRSTRHHALNESASGSLSAREHVSKPVAAGPEPPATARAHPSQLPRLGAHVRSPRNPPARRVLRSDGKHLKSSSSSSIPRPPRSGGDAPARKPAVPTTSRKGATPVSGYAADGSELKKSKDRISELERENEILKRELAMLKEVQTSDSHIATDGLGEDDKHIDDLHTADQRTEGPSDEAHHSGDVESGDNKARAEIDGTALVDSRGETTTCPDDEGGDNPRDSNSAAKSSS